MPTRGFPFQRDLWLYCLFTNLQGEYTLEIQLVGGPEAAVLNRAPCAPITESDPRRRIVRTIHFKSLNFVEPGSFVFRLLANGEILGDTPLTVKEAR